MQVRILVPVKLLLNPNPDLGVTEKKKIVLKKFVLNVILMANLDKIQNNEKLFYFSLILYFLLLSIQLLESSFQEPVLILFFPFWIRVHVLHADPDTGGLL